MDENYLNFPFMEQFVWSTKIVCHVTITSGDVLGDPNSKWRITKGKFVVCFICLHFAKMVCYCFNFKKYLKLCQHKFTVELYAIIIRRDIP